MNQKNSGDRAAAYVQFQERLATYYTKLERLTKILTALDLIFHQGDYNEGASFNRADRLFHLVTAETVATLEAIWALTGSQIGAPDLDA